jgi:hypothetical protein
MFPLVSLLDTGWTTGMGGGGGSAFESEIFCSLRPGRLLGRSAQYSKGTGAISLFVKFTGRETDHLSPTIIEIEGTSTYVST